jgi:hypothetical protein
MKKLLLLIVFAFGVYITSAQSTDAQLTTQANVIRDETSAGGNTKTRIAAMFQALIDSKVNEIDYATDQALKQDLLTNSAGLASALSDESGTGTVVFSSVTDGKQNTLTNSAGLASALSDESGTGTVVFSSVTDAKAPTASPTFTGTVVLPSTTSIGTVSNTEIGYVDGVTSAIQTQLNQQHTEYGLACSDLTTALTTGTSKAYFRVPRGFTVTAVRASLLTAQTAGSILTIDINEGGTTILSTKLTIDNSEKTSTTAATAAVISDSSLADDAEITIDIDQVGTSPAGLIVWLIGY